MLRLFLVVLCIFGWAGPAWSQEGLRIDLNIPALKLAVYEGDQLLEVYPIAVGMADFPTPIGSFTVSHAEWNPWWYPPTHREWARHEKPTPPGPRNPMGRVKLFFLPMYFIHGTPAGESIGTPASHGCVRMLDKDVVALARLLHERAAPQLSNSDIDRILSRRNDTRRVNFRGDIEIDIRYDPVVVEKSEILAYPDIYGLNAIHSEGVYQALIAAGYDVSEVAHEDVRRFVDRVRGQRAPVVVKLEEAFGGRVALIDS